MKKSNFNFEEISKSFSKEASKHVANMLEVLKRNPAAYDANKVIHLLKRTEFPEKYSEDEKKLIKLALIASSYCDDLPDLAEPIVDFRFIPKDLRKYVMHVVHFNHDRGFIINVINQFD